MFKLPDERFLIQNCFSGVSYLNQGHLQAEIVTLFCKQTAVVAHKQQAAATETGINANSCEKEKENI